MAVDSELIKTGVSVVLNHELTYGSAVEAVDAFVESTLNIPARTPAVSPAEIRFSPNRVFSIVRETETLQPARGPKTRMFDTSVPGQRLP